MSLGLGWYFDLKQAIVLPRANTQDGAGSNSQSVLRLNHVHIPHPGVRVLDINEAPGKRACQHHIEAASHTQRGSIPYDLYRPVAALWIMRQGSVAIVPFGKQLLP